MLLTYEEQLALLREAVENAQEEYKRVKVMAHFFANLAPELIDTKDGRLAKRQIGRMMNVAGERYRDALKVFNVMVLTQKILGAESGRASTPPPKVMSDMVQG